jgi:hypothetical protein
VAEADSQDKLRRAFLYIGLNPGCTDEMIMEGTKVDSSQQDALITESTFPQRLAKRTDNVWQLTSYGEQKFKEMTKR